MEFFLGWSAFAGLFVMLIIIPINGIAAGKIKSLQTEQMKCKDERVKITNEVLSGIKVSIVVYPTLWRHLYYLKK